MLCCNHYPRVVDSSAFRQLRCYIVGFMYFRYAMAMPLCGLPATHVYHLAHGLIVLLLSLAQWLILLLPLCIFESLLWRKIQWMTNCVMHIGPVRASSFLRLSEYGVIGLILCEV